MVSHQEESAASAVQEKDFFFLVPKLFCSCSLAFMNDLP